MILAALACRFKSRLGQAVLAVIIATLILRFPILTEWMDAKMRTWIFDAADSVRTLALPVILFFCKSFSETGGTTPLTPEAKERTDK